MSIDMRKQRLTEEQKRTITTMAADGKTVNEIANAIEKWPSTVAKYVQTHQIQIREEKGLLCDGTPKATRVHSGQCPVIRIETQNAPHPSIPPTPSPQGEGKGDGEGEEEKTMDELKPWRDWMSDRMCAIRDAVRERMKTMHEVPDSWIREYNDIIGQLEEYPRGKW